MTPGRPSSAKRLDTQLGGGSAEIVVERSERQAAPDREIQVRGVVAREAERLRDEVAKEQPADNFPEAPWVFWLGNSIA